MRIPHALFTVRGMMVVVALSALWLAAVDATRRTWPRPPLLPCDGEFWLEQAREGRGVELSKNPATGGVSYTFVVQPPRPGLAWVCSPLVVAAALTLTAFCAVWRGRNSAFGRKAVLGLSLVVALLGLRGWWTLYGGDLPLNRLSLGMTKEEARAIVGPPNPEGSTADSWLITRPGSLDWLRLEFNAVGRLRAYPPRSHLRERDLGSGPATGLWGD